VGDHRSERRPPSYRVQLVASLLVAALIVLLAVAVVTAKIGPGPDAREYRELQERIEEQQERREERQEDLQG
jgi:hypothetical protein